MTQGNGKISNKRNRALKRNRFFGMLIILTIGAAALCLFFSLVHIGGLRVEYAEAYYNGDTAYANQLHNMRQTIGDGTGFMALLYNLPFIAKLLLFIVSGIVSGYSIYSIYFLYKANKKTKRSVRAQLYKYHLQKQTKKSW